MIAARYFDLIREMKHNTYNHRLRLVESAHQRGINRAPVLHNRAHGPEVARSLPAAGTIGLVEHSRARNHQPHQTPSAVAAQMIELRKTLPTFGGRRLPFANSIVPSAMS